MAHAGDLLDDLCHPRDGPQIGGKTIRSRAFLQRGDDIGQLRIGDPRKTTSTLRTDESGASVALPHAIPLRHALGRNTKRSCHLSLTLSPPKHLRSTHTPLTQPIEVPTRPHTLRRLALRGRDARYGHTISISH